MWHLAILLTITCGRISMIGLSQFEMWFVTGSQHLYGDETLHQVAVNAEKIATFLNQNIHIPVKVVFKPVVTGSQGSPQSVFRQITVQIASG